MKVLADLINSTQTKYLQETTAGDKVPNWLIINTDIRMLERICQGRAPPKSQIQQLLKEYSKNFSVTQAQTKPGHSTNPVKQLWEQKGICFPGKGVLPTRSKCTSGTCRHVIYETPTSTLVNTSTSGSIHEYCLTSQQCWRKKDVILRWVWRTVKACSSSVAKQDVKSDYGLTKLFDAAQLISDWWVCTLLVLKLWKTAPRKFNEVFSHIWQFAFTASLSFVWPCPSNFSC